MPIEITCDGSRPEALYCGTLTREQHCPACGKDLTKVRAAILAYRPELAEQQGD